MGPEPPFALPDYALALGGTPRGFFCRLEVGGSLRVLCTVAAERSPSGQAELCVAVSPAPGVARPQLAACGGRLQRLFTAAALLQRHPRTRLGVVITVLRCEVEHDVLHHLVNAATLALLHAQVELRMVPLGSSCFANAQGELFEEGKAPRDAHQTVLVQAFGPSRAVLLLSLARPASEAQVAAVLELLSAAVTKVGKELLSQIRATIPAPRLTPRE